MSEEDGSFVGLVIVLLVVFLGVGISSEIRNACVKASQRRKKERRYVKSLAATYDLPVDHVERALQVFGQFPVLETRQLLAAAEQDKMTTVQWHQGFDRFIEGAARKSSPVAAKSEALLV